MYPPRVKAQMTEPRLVLEGKLGFADINASMSKDEALDLVQVILDGLGIAYDAVIEKDGEELARFKAGYEAESETDPAFFKGWDMGFKSGVEIGALEAEVAYDEARRPSLLTYAGVVRLAYVYGLNTGKESLCSFLEVSEIGNDRDGYHDEPQPRRYSLNNVNDDAYLLEIGDEWPVFDDK